MYNDPVHELVDDIKGTTGFLTKIIFGGAFIFFIVVLVAFLVAY